MSLPTQSSARWRPSPRTCSRHQHFPAACNKVRSTCPASTLIVQLEVEISECPTARTWLVNVAQSKLSSMKRSWFLVCALAAVAVSSSAVAGFSPQHSASPDSSEDGVVLTKLSNPVYPPLARQTRVAGDVVLLLGIRPDGTIESAVVDSGHPLLKQAALDSAQQSQFECRKCDGPVTSFRLVYTFQLVGAADCCKVTAGSANDNQADQLIPRVIQLQNQVKVLDRPACICDPAADVVKVRSLKCLYLWRCSRRYWL